MTASEEQHSTFLRALEYAMRLHQATDAEALLEVDQEMASFADESIGAAVLVALIRLHFERPTVVYLAAVMFGASIYYGFAHLLAVIHR